MYVIKYGHLIRDSTHNTRANCNGQTKSKFILDRHSDSRDMFCNLYQLERKKIENGRNGRNAPAAFPTMGSKMTPINSLLMCPVCVIPSIESTSQSAVTATTYGIGRPISYLLHRFVLIFKRTTVTTTNRQTVTARLICGISSSSSSSSSGTASTSVCPLSASVVAVPAVLLFFFGACTYLTDADTSSCFSS